MPETIRTANERLRSRPRRGGFLAAFFFAIPYIALGSPSGAAEALAEGVSVSREQLGALTLTLALICFATLATLVLLRMRRAAAAAQLAALDETAMLRAEIDRLNIYWASILAMERALAALARSPHYLLTDAVRIRSFAGEQLPVIKGDAKCATVAAASIIAKVHRDAMLVELDRVLVVIDERMMDRRIVENEGGDYEDKAENQGPLLCSNEPESSEPAGCRLRRSPLLRFWPIMLMLRPQRRLSSCDGKVA